MCEEMSTDNELLYMIRQQDDWAVENLLNKYKPMICGMIFKLSQHTRKILSRKAG